jgi:hypothetical protein
MRSCDVVQNASCPASSPVAFKGGRGRAVASIYSWGGCRPKISEWRTQFPNISWHTKPQRCLLSGKWRRNLQTKIHIFYAQTYYRSMQCRRKLFLIGQLRRTPKEIFKFRVSEMPFPRLWGSFDRILMVRKQRFSMSKFTICLQFSRTKWVKAYLINYILEKLQESMGNMILCSLPWIM